MSTHFYLLLFFPIIWPNVIGAPSFDVKVTMAHTILEDRLAIKQNNVVHTIWQQEPATACNIEKPPAELLTNKQILQFNFVPYLCVILYDASLRYLELNTPQPVNAQEIIKKFSRNTFCQKMKDNKWFTTIEENKSWVSNFSNDMENTNVCQRYCVSDIVNPICAYTLWLDLSTKQHMKPESLRPSLNAEESHPWHRILNPPKKAQTGASIEQQVNRRVSNPHLSDVGSTRLNMNTGNVRQPSSVPDERQTSGAVTTKQFSVVPLVPGDQVPATSSQNQYYANSQFYPDQSNIRDADRVRLSGGENNSKKSDPVKTEKTPATSNYPSLPAALPVVGRTLALENANVLEYPAHSNIAPDTHLSHVSKQDLKPSEKVLMQSNHNLVPNTILTSNSSKQEMKNPQKDTQVVKQSVSGPDQLDHSKPSGTTSSVNPHQAPVSVPEGLTGANVKSSLPVGEGEYNTEGQEQVSGDRKTSANLVGYEPDNRGQVGASNVASQGDSPKPSVPETPKIPVGSEEKTDQARVNTTVPENVTKEVSGSPLGGSTEPKPDVDQIGRSEPEAANQAMEGEGRAISGEPDDHEEQNAMDDSQVENGDALGDHGGDQTQDHDEAGPEMDQEFATETHRYNEGDNDEPSRPDGSTKLSNNNNKDYMVSDEDEGPWPPGKIPPVNDAEGGYAHDRFVDAEDSHFFAYFMTMIVLCILGYLIFHNKQKILALALEGRVRKGTRRRPSTSGYRKLDSNLEEAVTSSCTGSSVTHVIY